MNQSDFSRSIAKAGSFLARINFLRTIRNPASLKVSKEFNRLALAKTVKHDSIYFSALELNHYNILLSDYSILQYSLTSEGDQPELRMNFIPNPSASAGSDTEPSDHYQDIRFFEQMFKNGEIDFEEFSQALSEMELYFSVPTIRVDISYSQFKKISHPVAHVHIGLNNTSRLALDRIWSPYMFTLFIIKNFYHDEWLINNSDDFEFEQLFHSEKKTLIKLEEEHFCGIQEGLANLL